MAVDGLNVMIMREIHAQQIIAIMFRALAHAEAKAPISARGGFVGVHQDLDALQAVGKILEHARQDVLIVDPYMNYKMFTDFAPMAPTSCAIRLMTDAATTKVDAVRPALLRWRQQFGTRPIEIRLTAPRALHDRLIFADRNLVWALTQSLKDLASKSPALAQRLDPDLAVMKVQSYETLWTSATPIA
jgi:hypothetical protein